MPKLSLIFSDIELGSGNKTDDFVEDKLLKKTIKSHFKDAKKYPAEIIFNGDIFDFIKCPYKKKYPKHITEKVSLNKLKKIGFDVNSDSQIFPVIIGKEKTTLEFGDYLFKNGIFAQPIRYPTVPRNYSRIRISITARLTDEHIEKSLSVLENAKKKFKYEN